MGTYVYQWSHRGHSCWKHRFFNLEGDIKVCLKNIGSVQRAADGVSKLTCCCSENQLRKRLCVPLNAGDTTCNCFLGRVHSEEGGTGLGEGMAPGQRAGGRKRKGWLCKERLLNLTRREKWGTRAYFLLHKTTDTEEVDLGCKRPVKEIQWVCLGNPGSWQGSHCLQSEAALVWNYMIYPKSVLALQDTPTCLTAVS